MSFFTRLCRHAGLTIHHIVKPVRDEPQRHEVRRKVEESHPSPDVTLRRTTIEEIEVRRDKVSEP
ncbi:MAG: hypothetical protein WD009_00290 [Phycisphaeraceae bacterium]